jgi:hypothetical protein
MMVLDWPDDGRAGVTRCRECGDSVSDSFARVFGDNDDRVHACPTCTTFRDLSEGGGVAGDGTGPPARGAYDQPLS